MEEKTHIIEILDSKNITNPISIVNNKKEQIHYIEWDMIKKTLSEINNSLFDISKPKEVFVQEGKSKRKYV